MEFRNDPKVDDLDAVGGGSGTLVARRFHAGLAFKWEPGGDATALVEFVGASLIAVEGKVFFREPNGSLSPMNVNRKMVVIKPPAGEPFFVEDHEFTTQFASVDGKVARAERGVAEPADSSMPHATSLSAEQFSAEPDAPVKRGPGRPKKVVGD